MVKDEKYYFYQTPESLCKDIITNINFSDDEIVLEPFAGENNFYNNIPDNVEKHRTEIEDEMCYKSFDYEGIKPTSILSNPPFRIDGVNAFYDILLFFSGLHYVKNIYFLINDRCIASLTPIRLKKLNENNLFLFKKTTINVKKWRGRYYLLHFNRTYNKSFDYFIKNYE